MYKEEEGEYLFNKSVRKTESLPLPIIQDQHAYWGTVEFSIHISKNKNVDLIWQKLIHFFHNIIGHVIFGQRSTQLFYMTKITAKIDLFNEIDIYKIQHDFEIVTECKICIEEMTNLQKF